MENSEKKEVSAKNKIQIKNISKSGHFRRERNVLLLTVSRREKKILRE
jgi:hypothetical protein